MTPCGHALCELCQRAMKSCLCPMCRRPLPPPAPVDFIAVASQACASGDLLLMQQAFRLGRSSDVFEATQARQIVKAGFAQAVDTMRASEFCKAAPLIPFEDPIVLTAAFNRLGEWASTLSNLKQILMWSQEVEALRDLFAPLRLHIDRLLQEASQRVVPGLTLAQLSADVSLLGNLLHLQGCDQAILRINIQEALLRSIRDDFNCQVAQDFARAARALASKLLLEESQEAYVASVFASQVSCFVTTANLEDLDWIEGRVLPILPKSNAWTRAEGTMLRSVIRQTELLSRSLRSPANQHFAKELPHCLTSPDGGNRSRTKIMTDLIMPDLTSQQDPTERPPRAVPKHGIVSPTRLDDIVTSGWMTIDSPNVQKKTREFRPMSGSITVARRQQTRSNAETASPFATRGARPRIFSASMARYK
jgi:hypothetical protein